MALDLRLWFDFAEKDLAVIEIPGGLPKKHDLSFLLEQMKN